MAKGWIKLHRSISDNWLWEAEPFSKGQAWVDLLLSANHETKTIGFNGEPLLIEKGSFITSTVKLAEHWKWSRTKVMRFLDVLESEHMIVRKSDNKKTLICIENWAFFQNNDDEVDSKKTPNDTAEEHQKNSKKTPNDTADEHKQEVKNIKNDKNDKKNNISCQLVVDDFNIYCPSLPKVVKLTPKRIKAIATVRKTYSEQEIQQAFCMAEQSDFLTNRTGKGFSAGFDWLMNVTNMTKVLEGNYENKHEVSSMDKAILNFMVASEEELNNFRL